MGRKKRRGSSTAHKRENQTPPNRSPYPVGSWQHKQQMEWEELQEKTHTQQSWAWEQTKQKIEQQKQQIQQQVQITEKQQPKVMSNKKIKQVKEFGGMITCLFEHEVVKTTADYEWTGPKLNMPPEMWNEVLAFFRWTYDTAKSESQVRLFANSNTRVWKAWAFPQTEGTGMTTREIDNDQAKEQRAQFPDSEGWFYYGTVHHHCSASAFQSGTDEANERSQDGIHITVGKLGTPCYDIDARVYQSGYKLVDFEIEQFWDVGDVYANVPEHLKEYLPKDFERRQLMRQMGTPPPLTQTFPEIWKTNYMREARVVSVPVTSYTNYNGVHYNARTYRDRSRIQTEFDAKRFVSGLLDFLKHPDHVGKIELKDFVLCLKNIDSMFDMDDLCILDLVLKNDVTIDVALKMCAEVEAKLKEMELEQKVLDQTGRKGRPKQLGMIVAGNGADSHHVMDYEGGANYPGYGSGYAIGG